MTNMIYRFPRQLFFFFGRGGVSFPPEGRCAPIVHAAPWWGRMMCRQGPGRRSVGSHSFSQGWRRNRLRWPQHFECIAKNVWDRVVLATHPDVSEMGRFQLFASRTLCSRRVLQQKVASRSENLSATDHGLRFQARRRRRRLCPRVAGCGEPRGRRTCVVVVVRKLLRGKVELSERRSKVNFSALNSDDETSCRPASYHSGV
jgi:hypothetical protein